MEHGISAAKYFGDESDAYEAACYSAATAAGKTSEEAELCDDGNVGCTECPWRKGK
ncbi:hypothetical protein LCGC14_2028920 [marine sediment metagenome]|uniref:Uncharacterized protein n=1 Tax=marine sediment metagenome TaxID=412755 RepID=A0A0F9FHS2_9ZZZZ